MIIIGELINGTREPVHEAMVEQDEATIAELAVRQREAGADYIDCNVGMVGEREVEHMRWLVRTVGGATDTPIAIDTASPDAMRAGLDEYAGEAAPIINSITLERRRMDEMLPLVAGSGARVIALVMTDEGVPAGVGARVAAALRGVEALEGAGVSADDVFIDPIVTPLSVEPSGPRTACDAMAEIVRARPECHLICGLSNVSHGLPRRAVLNRVFLAQAIISGLDSAILDPLDPGIRQTIYAAEALAGRDEWCARYLRAYRGGELQ